MANIVFDKKTVLLIFIIIVVIMKGRASCAIAQIKVCTFVMQARLYSVTQGCYAGPDYVVYKFDDAEFLIFHL